MTTNAHQFSKQTKDSIQVGEEISSEGLIWRKLGDGTGTWRYDFTVNGRRYKATIGRESHGLTFSHALSHLKEIRLKAQLGKLEGKKHSSLGDKPFKEIIDLFLASSKIKHRSYWDNESRARKHIAPYFGNLRLSDISIALIESFQSDLINKKLSNATINRIIYLLSAIFQYAILHDESIRNPVRKIQKLKEGIKPTKVFTEDEIQRLLKAADGNNTYQVMIGLGLYAGMRASEVLGLEWKDVDFNNGHIHICQIALEGNIFKATKSEKTRDIPLRSILRNLLLNHQNVTGADGLVIKSGGGKPYHHVQKIFGSLRSKAGIREDLGFHGLRHTFATNATRLKVDVPTVQTWLGHSDIKTTMRYVHVDSAHSRSMMEQLNT